MSSGPSRARLDLDGTLGGIVIGVYSPDLDKCYRIPVSECPRSNGLLRVERPRNNMTVGIRWAADRELELAVDASKLAPPAGIEPAHPL